ncbi:phosphotransferase family protein [Aneurinibacillus tyrosinisolvens]|uniref:phosphotransferase family protein n=1 Tax=Aneurinibacillus tyrosinisolvens TaxID=1443435 RepID=UPI00063F590E|nr:aminoglycoside phosphotransferase family protein [Aneurinibacillus tyrosinisolvens]
MEKGTKIGQGYTAEVYARSEKEIVKLFHQHIPDFIVDFEFSVSKAVEETQLPVPKVLERVEAEGRQAIVYERITGPSMLQTISSKPWRVSREARKLAELHASIHTKEVDVLPSQREMLERNIRLAEGLMDDKKAFILGILSRLPDDSKLCHGDFHPGNILLSPKGPVLIDWCTGTKGNPAADAARTVLLLSHASVPPGTPAIIRRLINFSRSRLCNTYITHYCKLSGISTGQLQEWELPLTAARLIEWIPPVEKTRLLGHIDELMLAASHS